MKSFFENKTEVNPPSKGGKKKKNQQQEVQQKVDSPVEVKEV